MKIFIITMDDPIHTYSFIKDIIDHRKNDIIGLAVSEGDRMRIGKKRSKLLYLLSLLLIMGLPAFTLNSYKTISFKLRKKLSKWRLCSNPSILNYAQKAGINAFKIITPNSKSFQAELFNLKPDIIINQSQSIIKKELLEIPKIGVINRHNALLPKNRGRLTPFWVLLKGEQETGVSIHFVNEGIDSGDIIIQERFEVSENDNFNTLVKKNYKIAPFAMLKALDTLESDDYKLIPNDNSQATYNSVPSFRDALKYRLNRLQW